jgi:protein O-mannosyl-transferase
MSKPRWRWAARPDADAITALVLVLLAAVPYLNSLFDDFVYDDRLQILANPYVHSFRYLGKIFGNTVWTFEGAQGVTNYYRPLMSLAYLVCYKLFGPIPFGFHLLNLALHICIVVLLFAVTRKLFGDPLLAAVAAGLFALHPIHTESVAWIAGLTDLELSFFFLLTFLFYLRLDRPKTERNASWTSQLAVLVCYALALLSKEQALMLPLLAAAYEHFYRPQRANTPLRVKLGRYVPLFLMAAGYVAFRVLLLGGFAPSVSRPNLSWSAVLLSAVTLVGGYLGKLLWPVHLSAFYVFHASRSLRDPRVLAGMGGLLVCLLLFVWLWRRARAVSFAFLWMGATLGPVLNARWMPAQVFAERYLYLPSVGFCWLLGWASARLWRVSAAEISSPRRYLRGAVPAALVFVAVLYGARTVRRNRDWRSEEALYRKTLQQEPDAQIIRTNLGVVDWERGDPAAAEREWTRALGPAPPYVSTLNDLAMARALEKRYSDAIRLYQQAARKRPKFMAPHKNLATVYVDLGRPKDAEREFRIAVTLAPLNTEARNAYGHFLLGQGRLAEAQKQFALSIQADDNADAEEGLGEILWRAGNLQGARKAFQAALALDPFFTKAHFGLGEVAARQGHPQEAMREYRAGLNTDPHNSEALTALRQLTAATDPK